MVKYTGWFDNCFTSHTSYYHLPKLSWLLLWSIVDDKSWLLIDHKREIGNTLISESFKTLILKYDTENNVK